MKLEIKKINKEFNRRESKFFAVNNINLTIGQNDFISIIGHSGSGKSTLLNLIAGLLNPTSGDILLDGKSIINLKDSEISEIRNKKIGYILQGQSLLPNLTVLENVKLPFELLNNGNVNEYALELLDKAGIKHLADSYPSTLSGGEAKRVSVVRALINKPEILLADEPTSDLDEENTEIIMKLFSEISRSGTAVLMVTHNLSTINYGNAIYEMKNGILTRKTEKIVKK